MADRTSRITTWVIERSLPTGATTWAPVVAPELVAFGDEGDDELAVFLADQLATATPAHAARYLLPDGVEVRTIDVPLEPGMPARPRAPRKVAVTCVLVPHGAEARDRDEEPEPAGPRRRLWGLVPALGAAFFVDRREDADAVAAREIARIAAASRLDGAAWRLLLPPLEATVHPLPVVVRFSAATAATAAGVAAEERKRAQEKLDALATPVADRVRGGAPVLTGRDRVLASLAALLGGRERLAVLVVGDEAVGKTALVEAWGRAHPGKPAWITSIAQLVAGASAFGEAEQRVRDLFGAAERLDAVLYFEDFGSLFRERPEEGGLDLAAIVRRFVVEGRVRVVAEITPQALERAERRDVALVGAMTRLAVPAMDPAATLAVLGAHAAHWRRAEATRPQVTAAALPVAVELARRYLPYRAFPGKAVRLLDELRAAADGEVGADGRPRELGPDAVYDGFALVSGVPTFLLRDDRALHLDDVVARLRRRMIGQDRAVRRVAETLCTVKAQLQPADKPLATFLFVGPTGVGKTELARSLAQLLFHSAERLVRFDMSEYADPWAAERLIRGSERGDGLLTARIREQPFAVVLLDEIEKAHPAVHDLLLQVAGEGRLTDARGRTAYFHNAIVILTSNLGAHHGGGPIGLALPSPRRDPDAGAAALADAEVARYRAAVAEAFRPEMLNRLDAVIAFHRLDAAQIAEVARLQLAQLVDRRGLAQAQITLDTSAAALAHLAAAGYSPAYGVRALRRHLDAAIVVPAARLVARFGRDAHGGLLAVRIPDEPRDVDLPAGAHLGTVDAPGGVVLSLWRRGGAGGRRNAAGAARVSDVRRRADRWLRHDVATDVATQLAWLEATLARGAEQGGGRRRKPKRDALSSEQRQQLSIELARLQAAWGDATRVRDEIAAAEELAIAAALDGQDVDDAVALVPQLARDFTRAMFWLAVARLESRDEVTLGLSATDHARALGHWVEGLLAEAPARRWSITAHATLARDPTPAARWPAERVWGPPRPREWLAAQLATDGGLRNVLLRVRGPGAACLLGLEAGAHRFIGIAKESPCHLVIRRLALATDFTDEEWLRLGLLAAPSPTPRGPVDREHADRHAVRVRGHVLDVPWSAYFARLEEIALSAIESALDEGTAVGSMYPVELADPPADGEEDDA